MRFSTSRPGKTNAQFGTKLGRRDYVGQFYKLTKFGADRLRNSASTWWWNIKYKTVKLCGRTQSIVVAEYIKVVLDFRRAQRQCDWTYFVLESTAQMIRCMFFNILLYLQCYNCQRIYNCSQPFRRIMVGICGKFLRGNRMESKWCSKLMNRKVTYTYLRMLAASGQFVSPLIAGNWQLVDWTFTLGKPGINDVLLLNDPVLELGDSWYNNLTYAAASFCFTVLLYSAYELTLYKCQGVWFMESCIIYVSAIANRCGLGVHS